jgi:predicted RNase H-like HicB family nuclease
VAQVRLTAAITHEGSWYVARCLEVDVASQGETPDEARINLIEALELYFEDEGTSGDVIEPPVIVALDVAV